MPKQIVPGAVHGFGGVRATIVQVNEAGTFCRVRFKSPYTLRMTESSWVGPDQLTDAPPLASHVEQAARDLASMLGDSRAVLGEEGA